MACWLTSCPAPATVTRNIASSSPWSASGPGNASCTWLPATLAALEQGRITLAKARVIDAETMNLSHEHTAQVERQVLATARNAHTGAAACLNPPRGALDPPRAQGWLAAATSGLPPRAAPAGSRLGGDNAGRNVQAAPVAGMSLYVRHTSGRKGPPPGRPVPPGVTQYGPRAMILV
jgi:hypothetical protein